MKAVFATDLSAANEAAIRSRTCLECLERIGVDEVHLVTVLSPNVHSGVPGAAMNDQRKQTLEAQKRVFRQAGFRAETHVVRGTPHRRINGLAEQVYADLIVVGSRGESPLENRFIGSTARNVARTAVRPLLVERIVESDDDHQVAREHLFERILYATDFSKNAERAFEQFQRLEPATEEALLVHVLGREQKDDDDERADAERRLEEMAASLADRGIDAETSVREGEPTDEILAAEAEYEPTTVLVGSRGRSRIRRLLLGSVSEDVVARAGGNVLLVPPAGAY